jgi:hypothetical protein
VESAAQEVQDHGHDNQQRPNQHDVRDVELAGVDPAPDESPKAARDDSDNPVQRAAILELLDQDNDEANQTAQPCDHSKNTKHLFSASEKLSFEKIKPSGKTFSRIDFEERPHNS